MTIIFLEGPPGAGKSTSAKMISSKFNFKVTNPDILPHPLALHQLAPYLYIEHKSMLTSKNTFNFREEIYLSSSKIANNLFDKKPNTKTSISTTACTDKILDNFSSYREEIFSYIFSQYKLEELYACSTKLLNNFLETVLLKEGNYTVEEKIFSADSNFFQLNSDENILKKNIRDKLCLINKHSNMLFFLKPLNIKKHIINIAKQRGNHWKEIQLKKWLNMNPDTSLKDRDIETIFMHYIDFEANRMKIANSLLHKTQFKYNGCQILVPKNNHKSNDFIKLYFESL